MPIVSCWPRVDGDLQLGADAVGGRDQDRIAETGALQVEQAAKTAEVRIGAGPARRPRQRLDQLDQPVARVDVDAGVAVGDGRVAFPIRLCHVTLEPNFCPLCLREMRRPSSFGGRMGNSRRFWA